MLAITSAFALVRGPLSFALVVRGDDLLYQGNAARSLVMYARALALDESNGTAVDRYAFVSMTSHQGAALRDAIRVASPYLQRHPSDDNVRMDRALCEYRLGDVRRGESDFERVGRDRHDARALVFAGYAALRSGARSRALRWWRAALGVQSGYVPALRALTGR